jgi:serine/threonine protein kinase
MGDLYTNIQKFRKFSDEKAKFFFCELVIALEHLHSSNTLYLDLKPENILLDDSGVHLKLVDFGYSSLNAFLQAFDVDITREKINNENEVTIYGTPEYLG